MTEQRYATPEEAHAAGAQYERELFGQFVAELEAHTPRLCPFCGEDFLAMVAHVATHWVPNSGGSIRVGKS